MNILDNPIKDTITIKNFDGDFVESKEVLHDILTQLLMKLLGKFLTQNLKR